MNKLVICLIFDSIYTVSGVRSQSFGEVSLGKILFGFRNIMFPINLIY